MPATERGEVWLVDLGLAAKTRPCLVLSIPAGDEDRALVTVVPHTTALRGSQFEVRSTTRFLKPGAFDCQNLLSVPNAKVLRKLGDLAVNDVANVVDAVRRWLDL